MAHLQTQQQFRHQRAVMEQRSNELIQRLRSGREGLHVEQAPDLLDNTQLAADREFEVERLKRESAELSMVQRALDTIDSGVYGECIDCEQEIPAKRLKAMPWAVRCVPCQERFEEESRSMDRNEETNWRFQAA